MASLSIHTYIHAQVLEDHKELSEYGITAAAASHLKIQMYLVDEPKSKHVALESRRRYVRACVCMCVCVCVCILC